MLAAGSVNHVTACTTKYAAGIAIMSGKTLTISGSGSLTATGPKFFLQTLKKVFINLRTSKIFLIFARKW